MFYVDALMPALAELPIMRVVHPAYHWRPRGGHGSFLPSGKWRFNCDRVLATVLSLAKVISSQILDAHFGILLPCRIWEDFRNFIKVDCLRTLGRVCDGYGESTFMLIVIIRERERERERLCWKPALGNSFILAEK